MGFLIGLVIGLALGAAIAYFLTSQKSTTQSAAVQDLQRQLALAESEHERRLREATEQLRHDYAASAPATPTAPQSTRSAPAPTAAPPAVAPTVDNADSALAETPPTAVTPTEPLPAPTPQPPKPNIAASPVTATAPAPVPQSTVQSPQGPVSARSPKPSKALETSVRISDPNAVLAASYSPDAATRSEVASAIAQILPTAGAPAQARWFPVLGRLTRDADPTVRLSAVQALAQVQSAKRLPLLRRALKDTDPTVVEAANALISQTKGRSKPPKATQKRRLPKNK